MRHIISFIKGAVLFLLVFSIIYVVICKWMMPPITMTQLNSAINEYGLSRKYVSHKEISPYVRLAAMASEDQLFPTHGGFDINSIEKSIVHGIGRKKRLPLGAGASTISQQTAKNVFLWQGEGATKYIRKIPEIYFTKMIEWCWGKSRILDVYLNVIEMGPGIFGIESASEHYFHKHAKNLTRKEAAMIIACLPNPKKFTVVPMSSRVAWRYPQILEQMRNLEGDDDIKALIK